MDQVSSMSNVLKNSLVGVGVARVGTWSHKALLVSERDISQGKYRLSLLLLKLFLTDAGNIVTHVCSHTLSTHTCCIGLHHFMKYTKQFTEYFTQAHEVVPRPFPPPPERLGTRLTYTHTYVQPQTMGEEHEHNYTSIFFTCGRS